MEISNSIIKEFIGLWILNINLFKIKSKQEILLLLSSTFELNYYSNAKTTTEGRIASESAPEKGDVFYAFLVVSVMASRNTTLTTNVCWNYIWIKEMCAGTVFAISPSSERLFIDYWNIRIFPDKRLFDFSCQTLYHKTAGWLTNTFQTDVTDV